MERDPVTGSAVISQSETQRLLKQFLNSSRLPTLGDLRDESECHICKEPYLTGENPEFPIKLGNCGHVVGSNCVMKWLSPTSPTGRNSCSICRKPIFEGWDASDYQPIIPASEVMRRFRNINVHTAMTQSEARGLVEEGAAMRLHIWMQFSEAVVQAVEEADDYLATGQAPVARMILGIFQFDNYLEHWSRDGEVCQQILRAFPSLHERLVSSLRNLTPLPGIQIDSRPDIEVMGGTFQVRFANFPRRRAWLPRLEARMTRIPESAAVRNMTLASRASARPSENQQQPSWEHIEDATRVPATATTENTTEAVAGLQVPSFPVLRQPSTSWRNIPPLEPPTANPRASMFSLPDLTAAQLLALNQPHRPQH